MEGKKVAASRRQRGITKSCLSSQDFRSLAHQESRNESIGSDHLSGQPVIQQLGSLIRWRKHLVVGKNGPNSSDCLAFGLRKST